MLQHDSKFKERNPHKEFLQKLRIQAQFDDDKSEKAHFQDIATEK